MWRDTKTITHCTRILSWKHNWTSMQMKRQATTKQCTLPNGQSFRVCRIIEYSFTYREKLFRQNSSDLFGKHSRCGHTKIIFRNGTSGTQIVLRLSTGNRTLRQLVAFIQDASKSQNCVMTYSQLQGGQTGMTPWLQSIVFSAASSKIGTTLFAVVTFLGQNGVPRY